MISVYLFDVADGLHWQVFVRRTAGRDMQQKQVHLQFPASGSIMLPRLARVTMLFVFFLSGSAALIYQIVWTKQLALVFGVTIYAASAVVTAFMTGLALGSICFGRWVDRWRRPLVLFALLEAGIAGLAMLFPVIVSCILRPIYVRLYSSLGDNHYLMSLVRFALAYPVLLLPTCLMGGTLPVLSRAYVSAAKRIGGEVAGLYSVNNFGAFVGCVSAGYVLLEFLGLTRAAMLAVCLNLAVVVFSLLLDRSLHRRAAGEVPPPAPPVSTGEQAGRLSRPVKVALWVFAIEGFTSLVYQMAWMRMLIFFVKMNIYGITSITATFLVGLSLGAFLVKPWLDRVRNPFRLLAIIEVGIGLSALVSIPLLPRMFGLLVLMRGMLQGWEQIGFNLARFMLSFVVILVPTTFMGATMPVVSRIYVGKLRRLGRKMGTIGCLDTLGSIPGAFVGGFVLIPFLGVQRTIIATAMVNLALAAWMFAEAPLLGRRRLLRFGFLSSTAAVLVVSLMLLLKPVPLILYAPTLKAVRQLKMLYYREDVESSVSVVEEYNFARHLWVNTDEAANTTRIGLPSHELQSHIQVLLHPHPKRALLIGLGIGLSSWACRVHGVDVDVVELSPGVRSANRCFTNDNNDILDDPGVHLRIDDGRNYVLGTHHKYDLIHSGPLHPKASSGNASFYTTDFYHQCKRILTPKGIVSQWLPMHNMPVGHFKMLVRSFQSEFPHTSIWFKHSPAWCLLMGSVAPLKVDFEDFERRVNLPGVRSHLARCDVQGVYDLLDTFCVGGEAIAEMVGPGVLNTDNHPYIEFKTDLPLPRSSRYNAENIRLLAQARQSVWPWLTNLPSDRVVEVKANVQKWFQATQRLMVGHYYGGLLRACSSEGGPANPAYWPTYRNLEASFQRVRQLNPDDKNAEFLWKDWHASHEVQLADASMRMGRLNDALTHLNSAARIAGGTDTGALARFYRDTIMRRLLPGKR